MSSDWALRLYREGEEQSVLDCLTAAFGTWPAVYIDVPPLDHLRWKLGSPGVEGLHYVIEAGGRIVGTRLLISQRWLVRGEPMDCTKSTDLTISEAFRGRGIFPEVWNEHEDACRGRYGLSLGFTDVPSLREYMEIQGHRSPANQLEHLTWSTGRRPSLTPQDGYEVRPERSFGDGIERLIAAVQEEFDLLNARSAEYLNWRYCDRRAGRFAVHVAKDSSATLGYIVLTSSRDRAFIADLLVAPGRHDVLNALVDLAMHYTRSNGFESLRTWCFRDHPYRQTLLGCGFTALREETSVSIMSYGPDLSFVFDNPSARLHVTPGDTDVV